MRAGVTVDKCPICEEECGDEVDVQDHIDFHHNDDEGRVTSDE